MGGSCEEEGGDSGRAKNAVRSPAPHSRPVRQYRQTLPNKSVPRLKGAFSTSILPKNSLRGGKTEACGQYQNLKNLQEVSKVEIQEPFLGESIHSQPLDDEESAPKRIRTFNLLIRSQIDFVLPSV